MIRLALALCLALVMPATLRADDTQAPHNSRNVILFVVDDQGFQAGCYGNEDIRTPNIDRLAASGVRFTRAGCTSASCSASRSVLLTGLHNHATATTGTRTRITTSAPMTRSERCRSC